MAWATMATATSFNPWIQVKLESLLINNAENHKYNHRRKCKTNKRNNSSQNSPLIVPIPIPTWLLAGPGKTGIALLNLSILFHQAIFLTYSS